MEFSSPEETLAAMLVTTKWLPELVRRTEAGVKAMGLTIEKRLSAQHEVCDEAAVAFELVAQAVHELRRVLVRE